MDAIGSLELAWAQGYKGGQSSYITRDTLCFKCGNNIKFLTSDGTESVFPSPGDGLGPLAVHSMNKVFAFTDQNIGPTIYVFQYPSLYQMSELKDGATLEYIDLAFSSSEYLASMSGIPDFEITIWRYGNGTKLCSVAAPHHTLTGFSFNPANWRQMCLTSEKELSLWSVECSNDKFLIQKQKLRLPAVDVEEEEEEDKGRDLPTRASTRLSRVTADIPMSAIAGVKGEEAERFEDYQDSRTRAVPLSHTWLPTGDIIVGCAGGQLLRVDGEKLTVTVMYNPMVRMHSSLSLDELKYGRQTSDLDASVSKARKVSLKEGGNRQEQSSPSKGSILKKPKTMMSQSTVSGGDPGCSMLEGAVNCLALHKDGVYAAGEDGTLRLLDVKTDRVEVKATYPIGAAISAMTWNGPHTQLALGSPNGSIYAFEPSNPSVVPCLSEVHHGQFVGVDVLVPGTDLCVTVREDGEVQLWNVETAKLVSSMPIGLQASKMAVSPLSHLVVVGTASGYLYYVDLNNIEELRIIHRIRLHEGPLKHLSFNYNGHFLVTASDDGHVFVVDGRASSNFDTLGYIDVPGKILNISTVFEESTMLTKVAIAVDTISQPNDGENGANKLIHFELPYDLDQDLKTKHASLKQDLSAEVTKRVVFNFSTTAFGICLAHNNMLFGFDYNSNRLMKIPIPEVEGDTSQDLYLFPDDDYEGHGLPSAGALLSPHGKWLATYGIDGKMSVRAIGAPDRVISVMPHNYRTGGVISAAFSADGWRMFTVGDDGILTGYKWNFSTSGSQKAKSAVEAARAKQSQLLHQQQRDDDVIKKMPEWSPPTMPPRPLSEMEKADQERQEKEEAMEKAMEDDIIYSTPTPTPGADATWLETKELEAIKEEDKEYAHIKKELRTEIRDMRRQIQAMMQNNEVVPDIERLERHEFDLDVEEQTRLQAEAEAEVARIREEKEFENLAKMYLADLIKRECWDGMAVKGRGIKAFNSALETHNYPLKPRSRDEMEELEQVKQRRTIEMTEIKARKEFTEAFQKTTSASLPMSSTLRQKYVGDRKPKAKADDDLNETEDVEGEGREQPSTIGSLGQQRAKGGQFGGESDLFYSQFELHTREQKMNQIVLLKDAIHRIKQTFNTEFDSVFDKKVQEISKIGDKNKRIEKILDDLELPQELYEPELGVLEKPEKLLVVEDYEVKVEKFLAPEQRRKMEEEKRLEEERRAKEKGDNWRERGLDMMMGGVLEIKKEDELKKDIPQPAFLTTKPEEEWNEDEKRMAQDYLRRVRELAEERDKYRKQLEMELKKLQTQISEGTVQFDEALQALFNHKIKAEMVIYQEELKILRLRYSLLLEEELNNREDELSETLEFKKEMKQLSALALTESKKHVDAFRELYEGLLAEDKVLDKAFKREFHDIPGYQIDQLYKLFRRRPRGKVTRGMESPVPPPINNQGQKGRHVETPMFDPNGGNPFSERPSTARQNELAKVALESALAELDKDSNIPEGIDNHVWERMCRYRRNKIESEQLVKQKALVLADMQAFLQHRQEEDERLHHEIDDLYSALNKLKEDRLRFICNLEIQLLLKQGQVEVDSGPFIHNYHNSLLIHRQVVEDLNQKIRHYGESKIASMVESKDNRKSIVQLEWEHLRMTMEMEDLQNKMRDIQNLKVTREIQGFLNETDHEAKKAQEISILEQTLALQSTHHEKNVSDKKRMLKDLKKTIKEKTEENASLSKELEELNVSVNERKHIHEVNADKRSDAGAETRYREIVQRRKLVDLAKAQAQEVAILRAEVERLRMRTFPALVQVEH